MATAKSSAKTPPSKRAAAPSKPVATKTKTAIKPAAKPKTVKPKSAATKVVRTKAKKPVPAEQRRHYIEVAAYHIAERRGFAPGDTLQDWIQAEAEIDRLLAEGRLGS